MFEKEKKPDYVEISDLAELCTKDNADTGIWKQFVAYGKKYNLEIKIFGNDADVVQKYTRQKAKEQMKNIRISAKQDVELDDDTIDNVLETNIDGALVRFGGIRKMSDKSPLIFNGKDVAVEKNEKNTEIYAGILRGMPEMCDFIMKEAAVRADFLADGKKN